eukprot:CAMPEP_0184386352 /NCGR_PEP_ID=MMETSP0007-20130409/9714_1 /TAXON_ID=97485 /ORGANISM="Prymnesium parvum, Strain Texoma1" /LENGTH=142 /DNA_ID=CAMNT_0026734171 /DNA_START=461 /DNA_END=886 /DNA_ORIENTATION=-
MRSGGGIFLRDSTCGAAAASTRCSYSLGQGCPSPMATSRMKQCNAGPIWAGVQMAPRRGGGISVRPLPGRGALRDAQRPVLAAEKKLMSAEGKDEDLLTYDQQLKVLTHHRKRKEGKVKECDDAEWKQLMAQVGASSDTCSW